MISPEEAARLSERLVAQYRDLEAQLLRLLAQRVGRDLASDDWASRRLAEQLQLRRQVQRELERVRRLVPPETSVLVAEAWGSGTTEARAELAAVHAQPDEWTPPFAVRPAEGAIAALEAELAGKLGETDVRILRSADDIYRSVIAEVTQTGLTGELTRRQAAQAALDRFAMRGVTGFEDRLGRQWSLSSYTEMACRTTAAHASLEARTQGYLAAGKDLVIVSDAPGECDRCRPWEGKVLSLSGSDDRYPPLADATAAGLFHPSCRHTYHLYTPGLTRPMTRTADPEGDDARREQRYLERGVRQWKRREAAALDDRATQYARAKQREWQARLREHIDATGGKRLRYREQIRRAI